MASKTGKFKAGNALSAAGRAMGKKGGPARARKLSKPRKVAIARQGGRAKNAGEHRAAGRFGS